MKKFLATILFFSVGLSLRAVAPDPFSVPVNFSFRTTGAPASGAGMMSINGESTTSVGSSLGIGSATVESPLDFAFLRPGKSYTIDFQSYGTSPSNIDFSIIAPDGYYVSFQGKPVDLFSQTAPGNSSPCNFTWELALQLLPIARSTTASAGAFSGISLGNSVTWEVGLGRLRSGQGAGAIVFREFDLVTNAPDVRDRLYYTKPPDNGQVDVVYDGSSGQRLRQISVPQTVVDLYDEAGGGYTLKYYTPAQATWNGSLYTFTGQTPWRTIRVESPGTSQLKITETEGSVSRISSLVLTSGSVASRTYAWTLKEGDGTTWLRTTTHTSTDYPSATPTPYRDDVAEVYTGDSSTLVSKTKYRYESPVWADQLVNVFVYPTSGTSDEDALTTTYTYHTTYSNFGNFGKVQSVTGPAGNWVSYLYYDDWHKRGQLETETRPYGDTPGTVQSADPSVGNSVSHVYVPDFSGRYRLESSADHFATDVQTGQTWTTPTLSLTQNGLKYTRTQTDVYASSVSGDYLRTVADVIDPGTGSNADYSSLPYAVKRPDQSQDSYAYYLGTYSGTTFTTSGSGTYFRTIVWHGSTSSSGATSFSSYDGATVSTINLIANRSTMDVSIRDPAGNVVRTETHVFTGGTSFSLMTSEDFTYDGAGRLTDRVAGNGATVHNDFTNGRLSSTKDVAGTETDFTYDELGRVHTSVKKGTSASGYTLPGDITTTYTYDGANHATQTQTTGGSLTLTSTAQYDLAGRLTEEVQFSGSSTHSLATGFVYSSGGKIVTATLPTTATKVTETYLDGQLKSITGTAVVNEFMTYSRDGTSGNRSAEHRFASTSSPTATTTTTDWLGRKISLVQPSPTGTGTTTESWHYNSCGQLDKFSQPAPSSGTLDTLYVYDTLGGLSREGLDIDGTGGSLDPASNDRITDHAWTYFSSGSDWWRRDTTSTYATASSGTATQVSKVETQLSGFSAAGSGFTRLARKDSFDIYGNVTTAYTEVKRADNVVVTTTDTPDSTTNAVQTAYNGLTVDAIDSVGVDMKYGYDNLGRQTLSIDPRTGTTSTAYITDTNLVYTITDPGTIVQATYAYEDNTNRVKSVEDGVGKLAYFDYNDRDQKTREWGETVHPVEYFYNAYGRQTAMRTFAKNSEGQSGGTEIDFTGSVWPTAAGNDLNDNPSTPPSKGDRTLWNFQESTGLLVTKTGATGKAVSFTYKQTGQVDTRTLARIFSGSTHVYASYGYSGTTGELTSVSYNGTGAISYTYNRLGQLDTVGDATGTRTFSYNHGTGGTLELQSETLSASFYGSRRLGYDYDTSGTGTKGRLTLFGLGTSSNHVAEQYQDYAYYPDGRLNYTGAYSNDNSSLSQGFGYGYEEHSHLVNQVLDTAASYTDLRTYDDNHDWVASRTTSISSTPKASFVYTPDDLGRVQDVAKAGKLFDPYGNGMEGLKTTYGYDDRSQLTSEETKVGTTTTVLTGRTDSFTYDNIGNRSTGTHNANSSTYTPNALNQYSQRTDPGTFDTAGATTSGATVFTNGVTPSTHGGYFFQDFLLDNSSAASVVNSVAGVTTQVKSLNGVYGFNWQNQSVTTVTNVAGPTADGALVSVLEFGGAAAEIGMEKDPGTFPQGHGYTFQNGHTYTFGFWARTTSGTRSITPVMTEDGNSRPTSATYTINTHWQWVTVTKTYSAVGSSPRLFYDSDGGGCAFQVYGGQVADLNDPQYAGLIVGYVLETPQTFTYDDDGNLTYDNRWAYSYDAENRLAWMETASPALSAGVPRTAIGFMYDYLGRRVAKILYSWTGSTWHLDASEIYVYRGWNLTALLDDSRVLQKTFFWGLDLSGTSQGAGGVGGLLLVQEDGNSYLPMYDGNGNIHGMITAASVTLGGDSYSAGDIVAAYEYDAFGNTIRESGDYAALNPFRYSTKYTDIETGLVYYGLRYYSPSLGRFLNQDPIQEAAGLNLYGFCGNNGVNAYDYLGNIERGTLTDDQFAAWQSYKGFGNGYTASYDTGRLYQNNIWSGVVVLDSDFVRDTEGHGLFHDGHSAFAYTRTLKTEAGSSEANRGEVKSVFYNEQGQAVEYTFNPNGQKNDAPNSTLMSVADMQAQVAEIISDPTRLLASNGTGIGSNGAVFGPGGVYVPPTPDVSHPVTNPSGAGYVVESLGGAYAGLGGGGGTSWLLLDNGTVTTFVVVQVGFGVGGKGGSLMGGPVGAVYNPKDFSGLFLNTSVNFGAGVSVSNWIGGASAITVGVAPGAGASASLQGYILTGTYYTGMRLEDLIHYTVEHKSPPPSS